MSAFLLKFIACFTMLLCHIPFVYPQYSIPLVYIGKLSFPLFAFLISEGYVHTRNFKKYLTRLIVFGVISQIPAYLLFVGKSFNGLYLNIFFTLAFGLFGIRLYDKIKSKYISVPIIFLLAVIAELLKFDYGAFGVLMIVCFYIFKGSKLNMVLVQMLLIFGLYLKKFSYYEFSLFNLQYILFQVLFALCSLLLVLMYNGKKGKSSGKIKLMFYFFYPVHLIILALLKFL